MAATIRLAKNSDCTEILRIYSQYINTPITFEYTLPSEIEFTRRMADIAAGYPYLVCEKNGSIQGYAYAHRHMERAAYQWNAELSVYLDQNAVANGLGSRLYAVIIDLLIMQGVRTAYACVTVPNARSEQLHQKMGFSRVATYHRAGYKCGTWHDVCWFEKAIAPHTAAPAPITPFPYLNAAAAEEVIRKAN